MPPRKPAKQETTPRTADQATPAQPAANVSGQQAPATDVAPQEATTDAPREQKTAMEAPATTAGTSRTATDETTRERSDRQAETVTVTFPLPDNIPPAVLDQANVIVKAKPERGRRRAGRDFTRDETVIPYRDLDDAAIEALTTDGELIVSLRIERPD